MYNYQFIYAICWQLIMAFVTGLRSSACIQWCPEGVYQIRLFKDGQWRIYIVDDYFPTYNGHLVFAQVTFAKIKHKYYVHVTIQWAVQLLLGLVTIACLLI